MDSLFFQSRIDMRHIPFLRALGSTHHSSDPVWQSAAAGYLVLRFYDDWRDQRDRIGMDELSVLEIHERIKDNVEVESELQDLLHAIVDAIVGAPKSDPTSIVEPWLAYASYLERAGHQQLARHVQRVAYGPSMIEPGADGDPTSEPPAPESEDAEALAFS